jgi:hypothetical protein
MTRPPLLAPMLLAAALALDATQACAQQTERLAATFSTGRAFAQGEWETTHLRGAEGNDMVIGRVPAMQLRLAIPQRYTAPPRRVRIYISLPQMALGLRGSGSLELTWQSGGKFLPGQLRAGQRAVLFEGIANSSTLTDTIAFQIRLSGSDMDANLDRVDIEPIYEIEAL